MKATWCDRCHKARVVSDPWYRGIHEGFELICWECHKELREAEYAAKGIVSEAKREVERG